MSTHTPTVYILDALGRVALAFPRYQQIEGTDAALAMQVNLEVESFPVGIEPYDVQAHHARVMLGEADYHPPEQLPSLNVARLVWVGADDDLAYMVSDADALEAGRRVQIHGVRPLEAARPEAERPPSIWTEGHVPEALAADLWLEGVPMPAYAGTVRERPEDAPAPRVPDIGTRPPTAWVRTAGATGMVDVEALAEFVPFEVGARVYFTAQPGEGVTGAVEASSVEVFPEVRA